MQKYIPANMQKYMAGGGTHRQTEINAGRQTENHTGTDMCRQAASKAEIFACRLRAGSVIPA
jgi:hypothetical protein